MHLALAIMAGESKSFQLKILGKYLVQWISTFVAA
jgi:hypothetical protein